MAKKSSDLRCGPRSARALRVLGRVGMLSCAVFARAGALEVGANHERTDDSMNESRIFCSHTVREPYKLAGWRLLDVRRIWANPGWPEGDPDTRHNAFTDLVRFKDHWYCVFRVGPDHMARGRLRVIRSQDGREWESVFFYEPDDPSVDTRDSKFVVTGDGRLAILGYESYRFEPARTERARYGIGRSMTWRTNDGVQWDGPHFSEGGDNTWIWSGAWHDGAGYGIAYSGKHGSDGALYRTEDFREWTLHAENVFPADSLGKRRGTEASLFFDPDGTAWMLLRDAPQPAAKNQNVGVSKPPYREWTWDRLTNQHVPGPKWIRLSDGRIVASARVWSAGEGYGDSYTALYEWDPEDNLFHPIIRLPSQGDNAYPGIVEKDGELWISYYSTHEDPNPELRRAHAQRSCIYLARVRIGGERFVYRDPHRLNPEPPRRPVPADSKTADTLPPRLDPGRFGSVFHVDLSTFVNRALADEVADDGLGGWSDQGPECDMRGVQTGRRAFGGVPFEILPERSVVVLRSHNRKPGDLPEKVEISVGRAADALYFLHAAAWFEGHFQYVLRYTDGREVTIRMDGRNFTDWAAAPVARFAGERGTFTTVAETVPNPTFGQGSLYRTEWIAPEDRRAQVIECIEFSGDRAVVPMLLAVTGVMEAE